MKHGRLEILGYEMRGRRKFALCRCDCGANAAARDDHIKSGRIQSCGCLMREFTTARNFIHGEGTRALKSDEFNAWNLMLARCLNPKNRAFRYYGGRGISVCERWRESFPNFLEDMGRRPSKRHSLDRIRVNEGYEPGNCRWATACEQARNTTRNTINAEIAENIRAMAKLGIPKIEISRRLSVHYSTVKEVSRGRQWVPEVQA